MAKNDKKNQNEPESNVNDQGSPEPDEKKQPEPKKETKPKQPAQKPLQEDLTEADIGKYRVSRKVAEAGSPVSPRLPQKPNPQNRNLDYPTCSEPTKTNKGCDAWNKCTTKYKGPYTVVFENHAGCIHSVHCRHWMIKYQQNRGNQPLDQDYEIVNSGYFEDPKDEKTFKTKAVKINLIGPVKNPDTLARDRNAD